MSLLENFILENESEINLWIQKKLHGKEPFFYSSCDVRYSGIKITQVDTNCFPAGFNNLSVESFEKTVSLYREFLTARNLKNILIFPEFHTRNFGYLKNVRTLKIILEKAGAKVKIATNLEHKFNINLSESEIKSVSEEVGISDNSLDFEPIIKYKWFFQRKFKIRVLDGEKNCYSNSSCFVADAIILNNDLSSGVPKTLQNIAIRTFPSAKFGWFNRTKVIHFESYAAVVEEFSRDFKIDPWLFYSYFSEVNNINFKEDKSFNLLKEEAEKLFKKIEEKYREYGIDSSPTIFIKPNKGTYGMGIHVIRNISDIDALNKNIRKKMAVIKEGIPNTSVILQEGVPTILREGELYLEPVVYSALSHPIGMFFRLGNSPSSNLNSKGMELRGDINISNPVRLLANLVATLSNIAVLMEEKFL